MSNKQYTEEFKREAVRQVTEHKHSTVEMAQRLGINFLASFFLLQNSTVTVSVAGLCPKPAG